MLSRRMSFQNNVMQLQLCVIKFVIDIIEKTFQMKWGHKFCCLGLTLNVD